MSDNHNHVKQYFLKINRALTIGLISLLIIVSSIIWYSEFLPISESSTTIGVAFMLLAVLFYQLPYISYVFTRRHFAGKDKNGIEILDAGWKTFKQWLNE